MAVGTPPRSIRVDDETWARWEQAAKDRATTITQLIKDSVEDAIGRPSQVAQLDLGNVMLPTPASVGGTYKPKRKEPCEHRIPPQSYCRTCDS